jgi:hypothetical protein
MLFLFLQIGMLIYGIVILVTGKYKLSTTKVAEGPPARIAGVFMLLPLPLALLAGFAVGLTMVREPADLERLRPTFAILEIGITLTCLIIAVVIGAANGRDPADRQHTLEQDYYGDADYRHDDVRGGQQFPPAQPPDDRYRQ